MNTWIRTAHRMMVNNGLPTALVEVIIGALVLFGLRKGVRAIRRRRRSTRRQHNQSRRQFKQRKHHGVA